MILLEKEKRIFIHAQQLVYEVVCNDIHKLLLASNIPLLILKGPHVGGVLYNDPADRIYCDLDVLVSPKQYFPALKILLQDGYQAVTVDRRKLATEKADYQMMIRSPRGITVELHRALADTSQFRSDGKGFFQRSQEFQYGDLKIRGLGIEDMLLHLCLHLGKRRFMTCEKKHLMDIALLVGKRNVDWDVFIARVCFARSKIVTFFSLLAVAKQLGVDIPLAVFNKLRPGRLRRWILNKYIDLSVFPLYRFPNERAGMRERFVNLLLLDTMPQMLFSLLSFARRSLMDRLLLWRPLRRKWLSRHPLKEWMVVE